MLHEHARNPHLDRLDVDVLYHLGLDSALDLPALFGDVRFVCMGGSAVRAAAFARAAARRLGVSGRGAADPVGKTERFSLYKVGPVISASHGIGMPSLLVLLHEVTKLLHYAGCREVCYIRIGTSGGLGVEPGTVVIADRVLDATLEPSFEQVELGRPRRYPTDLDAGLARRLYACRGDAPAVLGTTMGTDDFYEGQGRLDGAVRPSYTEAEKMAFLRRVHAAGVRNMEMEAPAFAAFTRRCGIPAAVACVTLLDRLRGDQVTATPEELAEFSGRAQALVLNHIAGG